MVVVTPMAAQIWTPMHLKQLKERLTAAAMVDTIIIQGEFLETPRDTLYAGSSGWQGNKFCQIFVDKSNITLTKINNPLIEGTIYAYSLDDSLDFVMRIDNTYNTIEDLKFDGYHLYNIFDYACTGNVLYATPAADYTEVSNCEFTNFGYNFGGSGHSSFMAIVGGGHANQSTI